MNLYDLGIRVCNCGQLATVDGPCGKCHDPKPKAVHRCLGTGCPRTSECVHFLPSDHAPNTTLWVDPTFNHDTGHCEDFSAFVVPVLTNPMER